MNKPLRVLVLEDSPIDAELNIRELCRAGFDPRWQRVETEADFLAALDTAPELILADYSLPQFDGLRALKQLHDRQLDIPFILVSGMLGEEAAVEAMKRGATDYLTKDRIMRLGSAVEHALESKRLRTENRQVEARLRASEERLRLAMDAAKMGSWDWNMLTGEILWTTHHETLFGYPPGTPQRAYADFKNRLHPEDVERVEAALQQAIERREEYHCEFRVVWPDDSVHWIKGTGSCQCDSAGHPVRMLGMVVDITNLKQVEQALQQLNASLEHQVAQRTLAVRAREERLRAIMSTAADAIVIFDQQGIMTDANPATERMFGYSPMEVQGQNVRLLIAKPYCDEHHEFVPHNLRTGEVHIIGHGRELAGRRKDGSIFPIDVAMSRVISLGLFTGIIRDISFQKELQRQVLEIAADEQRRIGQELHDGTGQELTGLSLCAGALLETLHGASRSEVDGRAAWRLEDSDFQRLQHTAERLERGLAVANRHVHELSHGIMPVQIDADGLRSALEELAAATNVQQNIICRFECPRSVAIPNNTTATQLYRIAQEALNNALRHGQADQIDISLSQQDGQITLEVSDNGIGFDPDRRRHNGTASGMGLRIMDYRAGMIGGALHVERQKLGGMRVRCTVLRGGTYSD